MTSPAPDAQKVRPLQSLFFKCTFMVALCTIVVVAVIVTRNGVSMDRLLLEKMDTRVQEVTGLVRKQIGGEVQFTNTNGLEQRLTRVVETAGMDALGALVTDTAGVPIYQLDITGSSLILPAMHALAAESLAQGAGVSSADRLLRAEPVFFGKDSKLVGTIVTAWTLEPQLANLARQQMTTLIVAFAVLLAALAAAAVFLRQGMFNPLGELGQRMSQIAKGHYEAAVAHTNRRDEIGLMARRLDDFRLALGKAEEAQHTTMFKGAAFDGTSAPLMVADETLTVTFCNPACVALLKDFGADLAEVWPGVSADTLIGASLTDILPLQKELRFEGSKPLIAPTDLMTTVGQRAVHIQMKPSLGSDGNVFGCVVEWADLTEAQRNATLLQAINTAQVRLEFDRSGAVTLCNDNFLSLINGTAEDTKDCSLFRMFADNLPDDPDGKKFVEKLFANEIPAGRFQAYSVYADATFVLEGSFCTLDDERGKAKLVIFLGADVTEQDKAARAAETARAETAAEQGRVVELLGAALRDFADGDLDSEISETVPREYEA